MAAAQAGGPITGRGNLRYTSYFPQVGALVELATQRAAERTGQWAEDASKAICPVDTGALRDSIGHTVRRTARGYAVVVYAGQDYALWVELGTSRMAAQPYLRPVLDKIGPIYRQYIQEEMRHAGMRAA